jgi:serine/threonine-protein kinase
MIEQIGHYKILDRLGAGGIGEVYRARDTRLGRTVAIKVLRPEIAGDAASRDEFLRDARAAARLSHPNVASLDEVGDIEGQPYLVFEFASGDTLRVLVNGRPINPRRALDYAIKIADALADIHSHGLVHQGLTPDHIIVTPKGVVKLLDVGLARWTTGGASTYKSPEQVLGENVDHRTDVFSLGVILVEMLTGRPAIAESGGIRTIPSSYASIVARLLARSVDARYDSAAAAAAELRTVAFTLDARAETPEARDVIPTPGQKSSALGWVIVVAVLTAIGALVWMATRVQ